ncbi:hypothetical protein [Streptomyces sp. KR80]|uniref:hypothetical protein n=1 Tax=Streptomyces sp. KR80 TaxID=3457426 RepID=UPI003FCF7638
MTHTLPGGAPSAAPERRTAWAEGVDRLRASATTEPGRLRIIGAVLAALVLAFGAVTAWQMADRAAAADAVADRSQPLSADAASVYRSLADADTSAAAGFLAGGQWPRTVRERYERDIATASALLVKAARSSEGSPSARPQIARLNEQLPVYTGLIEQARANNRQGLPLGGAYLRYANDRMRGELLPAAGALYEAETARLTSDYHNAESRPWLALGTGVVTLGALVWAQRRSYRHTNRVFNRGLLAATAASTVLLLWLVAAHVVARSGLETSYEHGAVSLNVLNEARIGSLQARADESLTLVARGAVLTDEGEDFYEEGYRRRMARLVGDTSGTDDSGTAEAGSPLRTAADLADDAEGREPVRKAVAAVLEWRSRHDDARTTDQSGDYEGALSKVIGELGSRMAMGQSPSGRSPGDKNTTGESFDTVDASLAKALAHEQREFRRAADDGRSAFGGLPAGAAALALLGATGALLGVGRRLSEYR